MSKAISTYAEFEKLISSLYPNEFERLICEVLSSSEEIEQVIFRAKINNRQIDIIAIEKNKSLDIQPLNWIVEIKKYKSLIDVGTIEQFYAKTQDLKDTIPNFRLLFVATSGLSKMASEVARRFGITVWGLSEILEKMNKEISEKFFSQKIDRTLLNSPSEIISKEVIFKDSLEAIPSGKENWSIYQQTVFDIAEHLFCPPLESPHYELADEDSRNRRDFIFENSATEGFWKMVRDIYQGSYIVMDAKNNTKELSKRPIIDIAHYLKPYGCGLFGLIFCRKGNSLGANHAVKEQWIGNNKMIVVLSDEDVFEMLQLKRNGNNPEGVIQKKIATFRMKL